MGVYVCVCVCLCVCEHVCVCVCVCVCVYKTVINLSVCVFDKKSNPTLHAAQLFCLSKTQASLIQPVALCFVSVFLKKETLPTRPAAAVTPLRSEKESICGR